jgi:hypothetical protein
MRISAFNAGMCASGWAWGACLLFGLGGAPLSASAGVEEGVDPNTDLRSWAWREQGVSLELKQILPDQTRAFFLGRGFSAEAADRIGLACVFQTIFRNGGERAIDYDLKDWSLLQRGERRPLRTREVWDAEWEAGGIGQGPRIAFRWALLPTVQHFEPGDYNWGMTSFGLAPGERFDLSMGVRMGGRPITATIEGVICAPDR